MKSAYDIIWLIAFSVDLFLITNFLKALALKWMDISLQHILEEQSTRFKEKKLAASEAIILQRESRRWEE